MALEGFADARGPAVAFLKGRRWLVVPTVRRIRGGRFEDLLGYLTGGPIEGFVQETVEFEGAVDVAQKGWLGVGGGRGDDGLQEGQSADAAREDAWAGDPGLQRVWSGERLLEDRVAGKFRARGQALSCLGARGKDDDPLAAAGVVGWVAGSRDLERKSGGDTRGGKSAEVCREPDFAKAGEVFGELEPFNGTGPIDRAGGCVQGDLIGDSEQGAAVGFNVGFDPAGVAFREAVEPFEFTGAGVAAGDQREDPCEGNAQRPGGKRMAPRRPGGGRRR